ncbi:MAG: EndoU domain-containing protein [Deinococcaceae bacterium]
MKYMGGHLRSELPKGAVVNVTRAARADGVYRGEIIFTSADGRVYRKKDSGSTLSTFFPDSWTPDQTIGEIVSAYKNPKSGFDGGLIGESSSGMRIVIYTDDRTLTGKITSAAPEWKTP